MQDRFKFRYLFDNKIYDVDGINFLNKEIFLKVGENMLPIKTKLNYEKLIQSTGLKDKNGKLIYEGDILKCLNADKLGVVEWNTHMYKVKNWAWNALHTINMNNIEIIGNIYENKELLND